VHIIKIDILKIRVSWWIAEMRYERSVKLFYIDVLSYKIVYRLFTSLASGAVQPPWTLYVDLKLCVSKYAPSSIP